MAVLSRLFRRLFLNALQKSFDTGELQFFSSLEALRDPAALRRYLNEVRRINWVVYAKPPFGSAEQVVHYVGRYTHRVAISNSRIVDIEVGKVRFRYKDYRRGSQQKVMTLDAGEFIRRFLIHILPEGFKRIRYYGFLGNRYRKQKLARCRELLGMISADAHSNPEEPSDCPAKAEHCNAASLRQCPSCHQGHMVCVEVLQPGSFSATRSPDIC
ncbi:hypothetical protein ACVWZ4_000833 [Bradyrhizobium sp. USDA 4472]